jgi:hypothetical protein
MWELFNVDPANKADSDMAAHVQFIYLQIPVS